MLSIVPVGGGAPRDTFRLRFVAVLRAAFFVVFRFAAFFLAGFFFAFFFAIAALLLVVNVPLTTTSC